MNPDSHLRLKAWINQVPRVAGATVIVAGTMVLIGWMLDIPVLKSLHPGLVSMKANTALAFVLAGTVLLLQATPGTGNQTRAARFLACIVGLIGLLTVLEYVFGWDKGIDQLLFQEPPGTIGTYSPGRMALNSAINFSLLALALATMKVRARWAEASAQIAALVVGMFGLLVLLAYVYGLPGFTGFAVYTRMALHTAVLFILLSIGAICAQPDVGIMAVVTGEGSGGYMARRLLLAAVGVPIALGWLVVEGEMRGFYGNQFGDVIGATAYVTIFVILIWTIGRSLNKLDAERRSLEQTLLQSEKEFKGLFDDAPVGYHEFDDEGRLTRVNQTELRMLGYQAGEMLGHFVWEFLGDQDASRQSVLAKLSGTKPPAKAVERLYRRKDLSTITVVSEDKILLDADGHISGIRTTLQDVTELKRVEESLKQSVSLLQATLESTTDGILVVDKSGKITSFNRQFAEMWSLPGEVVAILDDDRALSHVVGQLKDPQAFISKVKDLYAHPEEQSFDVLEFKDGKVFERYSQAQRIDGRPTGRVWSFRDVTMRKRAEQERESLISELKTALENVRTLGGLVPICSHCKKIRDDKGYWNQLEKYIVEHTDAKFTHGICPDCAKLYFPGITANPSPGGGR